MTDSSDMAGSVRGRSGTYGLQIEGVAATCTLLSPAAPSWPSVRLSRVHETSSARPERWTEAHVEFLVPGGGRVTIEREDMAARFAFPERLPSDEELVHPFFASTAAVFNRWMGREAVHASAFVVDGGAWAIVGGKGSGKSSTMAWLAAEGLEIVTDDVLVVKDGAVFAGPSCVDLRPEAARQLQVGTNIGVVGTRERWRVQTRPARPQTPLRGWIFPQWCDDISLVPIPPAERLRRLFPNLALMVPPARPTSFLDLAALPFLEFRRPPKWSALAPALRSLLDELSSQ
jgi:hypothetical protein